MKKLYFIGGPMGVGKTTISLALKNRLPNSVFLDGDGCWDANPSTITDETKKMVIDNIGHLLNNFCVVPLMNMSFFAVFCMNKVS